MSWKENYKKAITFSYDDGVVQDTRLIELLNQYGLKCTFNLNSELLGKPNFLKRGSRRINHYKISPRDVRDMYAGHEVAVHTLTHPDLMKLDEGEIIRQVEQDRLNLSELAGYEVVGMAYPFGTADQRVADVIRSYTGVRYSRTVKDTDSFGPQEDLLRFDPNVYHLNWDRMFAKAEEFLALKPDSPQVFYIWGHAYEMDYDSSYWMKLEEFFKLVSGKEDIFYGTNKEVLLD